MAKRKGLGNAKRFKIFERDGFACQYCGRTPPAVRLHVDHIHPVSKGGKNDEDNLLTACSDCNHGKHARPLQAEAVPRDYEELTADLRDRAEQLCAYRDALAEYEAQVGDAIDMIGFEFYGEFVELSRQQRTTVRHFLETIGWEAVAEAARIADWRGKPWAYFCGVCWRRIREREART